VSTHAVRAVVFFVAFATTTLILKSKEHAPHRESALITITMMCFILCLAESVCAARPK
jgi:hypothetical protein